MTLGKFLKPLTGPIKCDKPHLPIGLSWGSRGLAGGKCFELGVAGQSRDRLVWPVERADVRSWHRTLLCGLLLSLHALQNLPTLLCVYPACLFLLPGFPSSHFSRFIYLVPSTPASTDSKHSGNFHLLVVKNFLLGVCWEWNCVGRRGSCFINCAFQGAVDTPPATRVCSGQCYHLAFWRMSAVVTGAWVCVVGVVLMCISEL